MATSERRASSPDPFWWEEAPLRRFEQVAVASGADIVLVGAEWTGAGRTGRNDGITSEGERRARQRQGG